MEMDMSAEFEVRAVALERLSALVDGELDADATTQACAHWRESGVSRASWHAYQLIGDVLRSDDLASDPVRDAGFLAALSARLAAEPVVLAPQALDAQPLRVAPERHLGNRERNRRWAWLAPSAVAAGFVVVAGALMVTGTPSTVPGLRQGVAVAGATKSTEVRVSAASPAEAPVERGDALAVVAGGAVIRDAQLDRYLAAHKQFAGTSALGVPSGFLRSATVRGSDR
jgi:sigma-E factor negative regulatory protein RseA